MLTPTKLIILGLILFAVWSIFRLIERRNDAHKNEQKKGPKAASIELTECSQCGAWVDAPCGKSNCPING